MGKAQFQGVAVMLADVTCAAEEVAPGMGEKAGGMGVLGVQAAARGGVNRQAGSQQARRMDLERLKAVGLARHWDPAVLMKLGDKGAGRAGKGGAAIPMASRRTVVAAQEEARVRLRSAQRAQQL